MELTVASLNSVFVKIDDMIFLTKGTKHELLRKVEEVTKCLDEANLQLKAKKCMIAQEASYV